MIPLAMGAAATQIPTWLQLLGIGAQAAGPGIAAMLGKQEPGPPGYAPGTSLGSKPMYQPQVAPQMMPQQTPMMPGFLSRLLSMR
jgi:hypothetical protein